MTYWTEKIISTNVEKYIHKSILFYPLSNKFSDEFTLSSNSQFLIDKYYPENCITFRNSDIFCVIHFSPLDIDDIHIITNHYIIEVV